MSHSVLRLRRSFEEAIAVWDESEQTEQDAIGLVAVLQAKLAKEGFEI